MMPSDPLAMSSTVLVLSVELLWMIYFSILGFLSCMENCASFTVAAVVNAKQTISSF